MDLKRLKWVDTDVLIYKLRNYIKNTSTEEKKEDYEHYKNILKNDGPHLQENPDYKEAMELIADVIYSTIPLEDCECAGKCGQRCIGSFMWNNNYFVNCEYRKMNKDNDQTMNED